MEHGGVILALSISLQGPHPGQPNRMILLDRQKETQRRTAQGLSACNLIGVLVPKSGCSHIPWLNVGETVAPPDVDDHLAPEGPTVLELPAGVLRALINAEAVHAGKQQS